MNQGFNIFVIHQFFLQFDHTGSVVKGETDMVEINGVPHRHVIKGGTVTEPAAGHAHRYSVSDALAKVMELAPTLPREHVMVMNLCGRGDKDIFAVAEHLGGM